MNNTDFSFMKTGFIDENIYKISNKEKSEILSVLVIYMENAIKIAEKYVILNNRKLITNVDIILSLKSQALDNFEIWEKEETKKSLYDTYNKIFNELEESHDDEEDDEDEDDIDKDDVDEDDVDNDEEDDVYDKIKGEDIDKNNQDFLNKINTIDDRWNKWEPTDQEHIILKSAIDKTENKFLNSN